MHNLTVASPYRPSMTRTVVKTATYRFQNFLIAVMLGYLLTGSAKGALAYGGTEFFIKIFAYMFHERVWAHIDSGKKD